MNIYFIRMEKSNFYKIGKAINPEKRLKTLQSGNPYELELFGVISHCTGGLEGVLHDRFKELRVRGEWFELDRKSVESVIREYEEKSTTQIKVDTKDLLLAAGNEPRLTSLGFSIFDYKNVTKDQDHKMLAEARAELPGWLTEFEQCCKWLSLCHRVRKFTRSSYDLKHDVENYYRTYIPNGILIAAVIHMGFRYEAYPPNAQVAIGVPDSIVKE